MKISLLKIRNFRGIKFADLRLPDHVVLIGDNNTGKSTVLEAIDLVLGPDRLSRRATIDEHDFYIGRYLPDNTSDEPSEGTDGTPAPDADEVDPDDSVEQVGETEGQPTKDSTTDAESGVCQIRIEATMSDHGE